MAISTNFLLLLVAISAMMLSAFIISPAAASSGGDEFIWMSKQGGGGCKGSIAECLGSGEMEMESESTRRILATTNYISYGALQGNNVPCSQRDIFKEFVSQRNSHSSKHAREITSIKFAHTCFPLIYIQKPKRQLLEMLK
ncbi:rapid alkalinization factor isoform X1 [Lactuca sativa]|uniref:rapid alkalinization factor isoform X1 n=1 Tax=Lactuca sativa TaxID=4236 RepID=UPI000CD8D414|nr:rapid alkalinization factor isoform X1 [Lactuca sativa]